MGKAFSQSEELSTLSFDSRQGGVQTAAFHCEPAPKIDQVFYGIGVEP